MSETITIEKRIEFEMGYYERTIHDFEAKIAEDPIHSLTWGPTVDTAIEAASFVKVFRCYLNLLAKGELVKELHDSLRERILREARYSSSSTSSSSNAADGYAMNAMAKLLECFEAHVKHSKE